MNESKNYDYFHKRCDVALPELRVSTESDKLNGGRVSGLYAFPFRVKQLRDNTLFHYEDLPDLCGDVATLCGLHVSFHHHNMPQAKGGKWRVERERREREEMRARKKKRDREREGERGEREEEERKDRQR